MQEIENAYMQLANQLQQAIDTGDLVLLKDLSFLLDLSRVTFVETDEDNSRKIVKPIMVYAAEHGTLDIVAFLIKDGCDINARDSYGNTPLMAAVTEERLDIVAFLMKHPQVQTQVSNHYGETVSSIAYLNNNREIMDYLKKNPPVRETTPFQKPVLSEKKTGKFIM